MSDESRSPSLAEVINRATERAAGELHAGGPAIVLSYDQNSQLAKVSPQVSDAFFDEDGVIQFEELPVLTIPVEFEGAGGFRLLWPVAAGDTGWIKVADRSIDAWKQQGGAQQPVDQRRHHLADAVFVPGLRPGNKKWTGASSNATLGADGSQAQLEMTSNDLHLGVGAAQSILRGDAYRSAEDPVFTAIQAAIIAIASAASGFATGSGVALQTALQAIWTGVAPVDPVANFQANGATYKSTIGKVI